MCDRKYSIKLYVNDIYDVVLTLFRALYTIRVTFLCMRDKCKIINVQRNAKHLWYKHHGLFVNCPVVISVKSYLTFRYYIKLFVQITVT